MTRLNIISFLMAAVCAVIMLISCTDEIDYNQKLKKETTESYFRIVRHDRAETRVSYSNEYESRFETGDLVGVFSLDESGSIIDENVCMSVADMKDADSGEEYQTLYIHDENGSITQGAARYLFYYPFRKGLTYSQACSLTHKIEADQSGDSDGLGNYEKSDFLWDVAQPEGNHVNIRFDHAMANIIVIVSERDAQFYESVTILNQPMQADGIDISVEDRDLQNYTVAENPVSDIIMTKGAALRDNDTEKEKLYCRAAVPANRKISASEDALIRIKTYGGRVQNFKLNKDVYLKPGKNYVFRLVKDDIYIPEIDDDDSWVLDVLDPETGERAGLLCREYLHFVSPESTSDRKTEGHTGDVWENHPRGKTKMLNCQAWVFYNLQPGTDIPELSKGVAVYFIYDVLASYEYKIWPAPHVGKYQQGFFRPRHGFKWDKDKGECGPEEHYYLHGGTVYWNGPENKIDYFELPEKELKTEEAKFAFISIPRDGSTPSVKYGDVDDATEKAGIVIPHNLIDTRYNKETGETETTAYPLVKIGFNQFWMSKSLRTEVMCDGTPITCYNKKTEPKDPFDYGETGVSFEDNDKLEAGYIFPYDNGGYDPYNNPADYPPADCNYILMRLYNKPAIENQYFTPVSPNPLCIYQMPTEKELQQLMDYVNPDWAAKLCGQDIQKFTGLEDTDVAYDVFETMRRGERGTGTVENVVPNSFTANISGFNLRFTGYTDPASGLNRCMGINTTGTLHYLKKGDPDYEESGVYLISFKNTNCFVGGSEQGGTSGSKKGELLLNYTTMPNRATEVFTQVRFVLRFKNQTDGVSVSPKVESRKANRPDSQDNTEILYLSPKY